MGKRTHKRYTSEFKEQAAELASQIGACKAAKQLGVAVSTLSTWNKKT